MNGEPREADMSDPRVHIVWAAFKAKGWVINSLPMAQVAVAAMDDYARGRT